MRSVRDVREEISVIDRESVGTVSAVKASVCRFRVEYDLRHF